LTHGEEKVSEVEARWQDLQAWFPQGVGDLPQARSQATLVDRFLEAGYTR